jgi:hypothetical protein
MKVASDILSLREYNINFKSINTKGNLRGLPLQNFPLELVRCTRHKNNSLNLNKFTLANRDEMKNAVMNVNSFITLIKSSPFILK